MNTQLTATRLKEALAERKMSYTRLAERSGIKLSSIKAYAMGQRALPFTHAGMLVQVLGETPAYWLGDETKTTPDPAPKVVTGFIHPLTGRLI